jgi:hypothetical protein
VILSAIRRTKLIDDTASVYISKLDPSRRFPDKEEADSYDRNLAIREVSYQLADAFEAAIVDPGLPRLRAAIRFLAQAIEHHDAKQALARWRRPMKNS